MLNKLIRQLKSRNKILFYLGSLSLLGAGISCILAITHPVEVGGVPAWIKPMKFYLALTITVFTLSWVMVYLRNQQLVKRYSCVVVVLMTVELGIISFQAAMGRASHFNNSTSLNTILYNIMGLSIVVFTVWTAIICYQFFKQKEFPLWMTPGYLWGIRLGILFFVLSSFQGLHMAYISQHSIGGLDGGEGYAILNWSRLHGDLRVIHFFGMHSLQLFPLLGYYLIPGKNSMLTVAVSWLFFLLLMYAQVLKGYPLFG